MERAGIFYRRILFSSKRGNDKIFRIIAMIKKIEDSDTYFYLAFP
jgi:hypothetical protein